MKKQLLLLVLVLSGFALAQTEISLSTWATGDGAQRITQIVNSFMAENPDIEVNIEQQDGAG